jgi:hypothetical protein
LLIHLAAFFLTTLGLVVFVAVFFAVADLGLLAAEAFLTLVAPDGFAVFFAVVALFLAAPDFAVVALVFGFTSRGFMGAFGALLPLADFGVELDRGLVALGALAFLGFAAEVELPDLTVDAELAEATFLAFFGPGDFDAARFLVADVAELAVPLEALFLGFLLAFFTPVASLFGPSLNEPLAPLPFVCLKY